MIHPLVKAVALLGTVLFTPVAVVSAQQGTPAIPMDTHVLATEGAAPALGTTFTTTRVFHSNALAMKITAGGKVTEGVIQRKDITEENFDGLGPGKVRRTLARIDTTGEVLLNGQVSRPPRKLDSLLETPVILTRDGKKWTAALEKGDAFDNQKRDLEKLEHSFKGDPAFAAYGKTPRKPGDKWNANLAVFCPQIFGEFGDVKDVEGTFTIEFLGMQQKDGSPCAQLKAVFDLKGTPKGTTTGTFTFTGEGEILRSLRDQVDLAWKYTAAVKVADPGDNATRPAMQISGPYIVTGTTVVKR
ncbi:MAG: hypothetical protein EOP83_05425 [Verrucomicrobiaceae bacterium]|nr:MAG: hypothetical protein EOP83_05425 [Verrucomicrobiaceae bacterium]